MEPDGIKSVPFQVKKAGEADGLVEGQFEGYASVFGNVDSYGDIVEPGAFARSLAEWEAKGDPIPLLWGHDFSDPFSNIGSIDRAEEDEHGLKVRGTFDMDNPKAAQVYRLSKGRRVTGMSFAYDVRDSEQKSDGNHLRDLHIYEASVVPIGANPLAGVEAVKSGASMLAKAGRTLSAKNETALREARDAIDSVLSSLGEQDGKAAPAADQHDQDKASGDTEANPGASGEEPSGANPSVPGEEPKSSPSVDDLAATISLRSRLAGEMEAGA